MRTFLRMILFCALVGASVFALWRFRGPLLEKGLERWLNHVYDPLFDGSVDTEGVHLTRDLRLEIDRVRAEWQAAQAPFPIEVRRVRTEESVLRFLLRRPVLIRFQEFRPAGSRHSGVEGTALLHNDRDGTVEVAARFVGLDLEDLEPLDPEHLEGATGNLTGDFHLKSTLAGEQTFSLDLAVDMPGGRLQARFFDLLMPYIPAAQKAVVQAIEQSKTVPYREARLTMDNKSGGESVKALLHILVPDYNLNLNLNLTVRVESGEVFLQLAEVFGLIKVSST